MNLRVQYSARNFVASCKPVSFSRRKEGRKEGRKERDHWGDLGIDRWIILGWISRRWDVGIWTGLGWPRIETGGGLL